MRTSPIESKLVRDCIKGDRDAQYRLYRRYDKAMYHVCLRLMKVKEDAEDALQDAFVDVFRKIHTFRFESTLGAWIKRIVVNNCLNQLKKKHKDFVVQLENAPELVDDSTDLELNTSFFKVDKIKEAMQFLPEGYRVICSLYLFEGYDHQEIADILGVSVSTSKSQLHRGKMKLKKSLANG